MFGYAQQWPDEEVLLLGILPVRAWTVVLLFAVANLALGMAGAGDVPGGERVVYLAHLGGLAFGWLYFRTPPAASIERLRQRISPAPDYPDETAAARRAAHAAAPAGRHAAAARRGGRGRGEEPGDRGAAAACRARCRRPSRAGGRAPRAELDRVLDKISADGLESLSPAERAVLDEMARRLKDERVSEEDR